jgi:hypothetical protein
MMRTPRTHVRTALFLLLVALIATMFVAGCSAEEEPAEPVEPVETTESVEPTEPAEAPPLEPAQYELTFDAMWSSGTHPTDFPSNPHFSGLIGAVHGPEAIIWSEGQLASAGMKNMAETGGKTPLDSEIEAMISQGTVCELISGDGVNPSPGQASVTFTATEECPLATVVTMIAPSPDWFVGVAGQDLRNEDGTWADVVVVDLYPWDAGTDSGTSYASGNAPTSPPENIFLMPGEPPIGENGTVMPFGTFTFTKVGG